MVRLSAMSTSAYLNASSVLAVDADDRVNSWYARDIVISCCS